MNTDKPKWQTKAQLTDLLSTLVGFPSITGSKDEIAIAEFIARELGETVYFKEHPEHLRLHTISDGRKIVTGLVKKTNETKNTVILISHFDVVEVEDYGRWKSIAFHVRELTREFYANKISMPVDVQEDLTNGDWVFGRGTMDMKCGLTLHMSMIEKAFSGTFDGNLLLLAVCDEEVNSMGMRDAAPLLVQIAKQHQLEYKACLNSEPIFSCYPGDRGKYIYTGSIGKILPGFLCYGKETHVGEPFMGLNASYMASQITCELELNTELCEVVGGEVTPPPTNLFQKDLKKEYSVQIPHRAVSLFNLFLFEKSMGEVLEQLRFHVKKAAGRIEEGYHKQAEKFSTLAHSTIGKMNIRVLTYKELMDYALERYGQEEISRIETNVLKNKGDDREATIQLVDELAIQCKELAPMIVLFFAPPYYPAVSSRNHSRIRKAADELIAYAGKEHGIAIREKHYFPGISDLSYAGLEKPASSLQPLLSNLPLWGKNYTLPLDSLEELNVPVINLGPVGRDAHKWTERLDVDYAFEPLVDMVEVLINQLLQ
ncbi:M20/M25/M40 family metallo-hydrolase [Aneurinibacillus terranovensis]|uniref:M20/M25/M40 family metallo-hydrolase n=1 Tax=Aneurinibacillus terranovensis TaxID=278991 RepID=UPI00054CFBC2|nr:M20/M25/M40 family metallo-hydrolase [Aneurinibacillus terranovensis]